MLFKISNSFFYTQKVAYFVQKQVILIRSNPTYLRWITDQTRTKYDQPTLHRRPPRCTPAQHTTCGERDHPRPFFNGLKNWSRSPRPLRAGPTNPHCILYQHTLSPIKASSFLIRPFFQNGRERGLIGSLVWTGLKLPGRIFLLTKYLLLICIWSCKTTGLTKCTVSNCPWGQHAKMKAPRSGTRDGLTWPRS